MKERGYNQVAMIAWPLSMQMGLAYWPDSLVRVRETRSQVGLSAVGRKENVKGAFLAREKVTDHTILLLDDVSTTGATLSSAAEALYAAEARGVFAFTVARALPHHGLNVV